MEEETFPPKAKTYMFRGLEVVFIHCNKPSLNNTFENISVKKSTMIMD